MTEYHRMKEMAQLRINPTPEMKVQGYLSPVQRDACQNCSHCLTRKGNKPYKTPTHHRCGIGDFPVSSLAICNHYKKAK